MLYKCHCLIDQINTWYTYLIGMVPNQVSLLDGRVTEATALVDSLSPPMR